MFFEKKGTFFAAACGLLVTLAALLLLLAVPVSRYWKGYTPLLAEEGRAAAETLQAEGFTVLYSGNATVTVNSYGTMEEVPLSRLSSRFQPDDPRLDPYVKGVHSLFTADFKGRELDILYLKGEYNEVRLQIILNRLFSGGSVPMSPMGSPYALLFQLTVYLIFALVFLLVSRVKHPAFWAILPIGGLVSILPGSSFSLLAGIIAFSWVLFHHQVMKEVKKLLHEHIPLETVGPVSFLKSVWLPLFIFLTGFSGVLLFSESHLQNLAAAGTAEVLLFFTVTLWSVYFEKRKKEAMEHPLFLPVPILGKKSKPNGMLFPAPALFLLGLLFFGPSVDSSVKLPLPSSFGKAGLPDLEQLSGIPVPGEVPGLADYVAHVAFQETFMYNPHFQVPTPGEVFQVPKLLETGGALQISEHIVKEFTTDWYEDIIERGRGQGIPGLLIQQEHHAGIRVSSPKIGARISGERLLLLLITLFVPTIMMPMVMYQRNKIVNPKPLLRSENITA